MPEPKKSPLAALRRSFGPRSPPAPSVTEVMTANPRTIHPDDSVLAAIELMDRGGFRHLPVLEDGKLMGMVSSRDALPWSLGLKDTDCKVRVMMTPYLVTASRDMPLIVLVKKMLAYRVGALPVLDGDELVGLVTCVDMLHHLQQLLEATAE